MPHALCAALLVCLLALPAPALALSFAFSGTVESVTDTLAALDSSLDAAVVPVTGTYEVVPSSSPFAVGFAHLVFWVGNYLFDSSEDSHSIALINNRPVATSVVDLWQSHEIAVADLGPATANHGSDFAGFAAQIEFHDFEATVFDGNESEPFVPDALGAPWNDVRLALVRLKRNGDLSTSFDSRVLVGVAITSWTPVHGPRSAALLALGIAFLAGARRRRGPILAAG